MLRIKVYVSRYIGIANFQAEQVREMFPQVPLSLILDDLRETGASQATVENILEGRLMGEGVSSADESGTDFEDESVSGLLVQYFSSKESGVKNINDIHFQLIILFSDRRQRGAQRLGEPRHRFVDARQRGDVIES